MTLSLDRIEALAPDQSSLAAARKLLKPGGWPVLAGDGAGLIWGECQGSGATPYRVAVTEADAGYKCSCPSRKFPCKHALALMWMRADGGVFAAGEAPQWVLDWLGRRRGPAPAAPRTDGAAPKERASIEALGEDDAREPGSKAAERSEAARERNRAQREGLITGGLDALDRWLIDQLERGLAGFDQRAPADCAGIARRLVDAKAGGLAGRIEQLPGRLFAVDEARRGAAAARSLGELHLISEAYRRQDALPPSLRADVRQTVGWPVTREALLEDADTLKVAGEWLVLATRDEVQPDRLRRIESWLARQGEGEGQPFALIMEFVPVSAGASGTVYRPGELLVAELAFFPSPTPLRALVASLSGSREGGHAWTPRDATLKAALDRHDAALAARPWLGDWPLAAGGVRIARSGEALYATDGEIALPLADAPLAEPLAGAGQIDLFGIWDGAVLHPHFAETPLGRWTAS